MYTAIHLRTKGIRNPLYVLPVDGHHIKAIGGVFR